MGVKGRIHQKLTLNIPENQIGLVYDGQGRLKCGLCNQWFSGLATHIWRIHGVSSDEYREEFSLNKTQPLLAPEVTMKQRVNWINRGMPEKMKHLLMKYRPSHQGLLKLRRQGRINLSRRLKGRKIVLTSRLLEHLRIQAKLVLNRLMDKTCEQCGQTHLGQLSQKFCIECQPVATKKRKHLWFKANQTRIQKRHAENRRKQRMARKQAMKGGRHL